jgi:elongation factor P
MIYATDLKNGVTFELDGRPYRVEKYSHSKIGRGGATVRVSLRDLQSGRQVEKTFNGQVKFDEISTLKRKLQFLYAVGGVASFMDPASFEQVEIPSEILGDDLKYIREGEDVNVLFLDPSSGSGQVALSVEIPPKVTLQIVETEAGVKGNSATNVFKSAVVAGGLEVKVPLFIKKGDRVKIDTRTGSYVERVN